MATPGTRPGPTSTWETTRVTPSTVPSSVTSLPPIVTYALPRPTATLARPEASSGIRSAS